MRAIRHVPVVLVALGTVACTALLGDFNVGPGSTSGGLGEGGIEGGGEGGGEAGALSITPMEVKVGVLRAQTFTASAPVTWAVQEGAVGGTIDDAGKFLATDTPGVVHVVATSKSDPTSKATATVTVAPLGITVLTGVNGGEGNIDGPPLKAHFKQPAGIAHLFDNSGGNTDRYFIADNGNHTIRMYETATQKVSTIAGTVGTPGRSDGVGAAASFNFPQQIVADRKHNLLYIVDSSGTCIRQLDPTTNTVTTVGGQCGVGGSGDGSTAVLASFSNIRSMDTNIGKFSNQFVADGAEALFVCDSGNRIRKLALAGATKGTTITAVMSSGCDLATDGFSGGFATKNVYYLESTGTTGTLKKFNDSPPFTPVVVTSAPESFTSGLGIASGQGTEAIYMLSSNHSVVYRSPLASPAFDAAPFFGIVDDNRVINGPFMTATAGSPNAIDVITERGAGSVLFSDNAAAAIRSADLGTKMVTTLIGAARMIDRVDGPRSAARLTGPFAITSDSTGTIFFTDIAFDGTILNNTIRKVDSAGVVSSVAGKPLKPSQTVPPVDGMKNDATFGFPIDLVSVKGNLFVVDAFGQAVRKITAAGDVTTLAGELGVAGDTTDAIGGAAHFKFADTSSSGGMFGGGIATDGTDLYVSDSANFAIRKITVATGQVTLLAGGAVGTANGIGKAAQFMNPFGLAYDSGFLYIADAADHTIRRLDLKTNEVTGFMGLSGQLGNTDGDAGTALFSSPARLQSDGIGNLFVAEIPFSNGSFPGLIRRIDIKARKVSLYAGALGKLGLATGSLPSTVNAPLSFTVTPAGDLAFVDFFDASVAVIKPL